ncbi:Purine biosynthetic protein ADE1 [Verticillium dahliae VDG1]|nr:Purine biosynthetic protein ADE1 [Verticillium dahliae VDG1]
MTAFYKGLLNRGEERHQEMMKAAEEQAKNAPAEREKKEGKGQRDEEQPDKEATDANRASEINKKGGKIAINEDGQVVDKRELLRGGLNVGAKKEAQLAESLKRSREEEEQEREKIETSAKSRKTEGEISSAKERYLARKREAEEAKKKKAAE